MNQPEGRKVVITGATGLLGRALVGLMSKLGYDVRGLSHSSLDITDANMVYTCLHVIRPSLVINCAAATQVDRCETDRAWAFALNAQGPAHLAHVCSQIGAELVHVSTDYVFNGERRGFYDQSHSPSPVNHYGQTKLEGEACVKERLDRAYIVRTSWLYGSAAGTDYAGGNYGTKLLKYARSGRLEPIMDQTSVPTYAPALAQQIVNILERGAYGLYQVCDGLLPDETPVSWYDFARFCMERLKWTHVQVQPVEGRVLAQRLGLKAQRPRNSAMRCSKSREVGLPEMPHWKDNARVFLAKELQAPVLS